MNLLFKNHRISTYIWPLLVGVLWVFRLVLNARIPLMDKTESRYAEVARLMTETGDWIMPQISYGVPFWAKPPLSTWASALSFQWFGIHEFAARWPYFVMAALLALMTGKYAKRQGLSFWLPVFVLFTIPEFFLHAGVVSTDMALAFSVGLTMLSFWEAIQGQQNYYRYLFFVGIGLGLLAKGPIVIILTVPPLFVWTWMHGAFKSLWKAFPWGLGVLLTLLIALPWYYLAEKQSPGFIDYFIVGEHFQRFFDSAWKGDKYGFPKSQPMGMVWLFLLLFSLPWIQLVIFKVFKNRRLVLKNRWLSFLILWLFWTPLFFTVSKSLIHPYIMPVMVPIALLVVHWWEGLKPKIWIVRSALILPVLAIVVYASGEGTQKIEYYANSDKILVQKAEPLEMPVFKFRKISYSGRFYSEGRLQALSLEALTEKMEQGTSFLVIVKTRDLPKIPETMQATLRSVYQSHKKALYAFKGNDTISFIPNTKPKN